jgi:alpha-L-arabinofuranosidase
LQAALVLTGNDLKAVNGFDAPSRVAPQDAEKPVTSGGVTRMEVPAQSYSVFQWGV